MWQTIGSPPSEERTAAQPQRQIPLGQEPVLDEALRSAPLEFSGSQSGQIITLPMPGGTYARLSAEESPIMQPGLASRYPSIKSYVVRGVDDPTIRGRLDRNPDYLSALLLTSAGGVDIHPAEGRGHPYYVSRDDLGPSDRFIAPQTMLKQDLA